MQSHDMVNSRIDTDQQILPFKKRLGSERDSPVAPSPPASAARASKPSSGRRGASARREVDDDEGDLDDAAALLSPALIMRAANGANQHKTNGHSHGHQHHGGGTSGAVAVGPTNTLEKQTEVRLKHFLDGVRPKLSVRHRPAERALYVR